MRLRLKHFWWAIDWGSSTEDRLYFIPIQKGEHVIERVKHPYPDGDDDDLLVIKDTMIGLPEKHWRNFTSTYHGEFQVEIY